MTPEAVTALALVVVMMLAACSSGNDSGAQAETGATARADAAKAPADAVLVEVTTADAQTLTANYTAAEGAPGVLLGHMFRTGKESWDGFAEAASAAGYSVLALDSRGYGGSTGFPATKLDVDLEAGVDFLLAEGAPSVVVIGASMNGAATIVVGSKRDLAGIATLSAPHVFRGGMDAMSAASSVEEPALIITSEDDEPSASAAPMLADSSGGELVVLPGNAHGTNLFDDHGPALTGLLLEFLVEASG